MLTVKAVMEMLPASEECQERLNRTPLEHESKRRGKMAIRSGPSDSKWHDLPLELRLYIYDIVLGSYNGGTIDLSPMHDQNERKRSLALLHINRSIRYDCFQHFTVTGHFYDYIGRVHRGLCLINHAGLTKQYPESSVGAVQDPEPHLYYEDLFYHHCHRRLIHVDMKSNSCLGQNPAVMELFMHFKKQHVQIHLMQRFLFRNGGKERETWDKVISFCRLLRRHLTDDFVRQGLIDDCVEERWLAATVDVCIPIPFRDSKSALDAFDLWHAVETIFTGIPSVTLERRPNKLLEFRGWEAVPVPNTPEEIAWALDRAAWRKASPFVIEKGRLDYQDGETKFIFQRRTIVEDLDGEWKW